MDLEIFWSQFTEDKLQDVFDYHKVVAGIKTSRKIITQIVDQTIYLSNNPKLGQTEELLKDRSQEFRYSISSTYKIIYYLNLERRRIVIANVFDVRQNPQKIKETR